MSTCIKRRIKSCFYPLGNNIKEFEFNLDADEALDQIDLLRYIDELKLPKFGGVSMRERSNLTDCGVVNLSTYEYLGTHWVCYIKNHSYRIYFDLFGQKTPVEIQKYLKAV